MDLTRSCLASTCGREAPMPGVVKDRPDFWIDAACAWKTQMMLTISPLNKCAVDRILRHLQSPACKMLDPFEPCPPPSIAVGAAIDSGRAQPGTTRAGVFQPSPNRKVN